MGEENRRWEEIVDVEEALGAMTRISRQREGHLYAGARATSAVPQSHVDTSPV